MKWSARVFTHFCLKTTLNKHFSRRKNYLFRVYLKQTNCRAVCPKVSRADHSGRTIYDGGRGIAVNARQRGEVKKYRKKTKRPPCFRGQSHKTSTQFNSQNSLKNTQQNGQTRSNPRVPKYITWGMSLSQTFNFVPKTMKFR